MDGVSSEKNDGKLHHYAKLRSKHCRNNMYYTCTYLNMIVLSLFLMKAKWLKIGKKE
jgi:hypothetical protein